MKTAMTSLSIEKADLNKAIPVVEEVVREPSLRIISATLMLPRSHSRCGNAEPPRVAAKMFEALAEEGINIHMISTSEIGFCLIDEDLIIKRSGPARQI